MDTDFFEDERIMAISGEFGLEGEMVAVRLLCMIYRKGYFTLWGDLQKYKLLRSLPGISLELLERIVARLVSWGFFDEELFFSEEVLTSKEIQKCYFKAIKRRAATADLPHLLIDVDRNSAENGVSACKNPTKKRKEKESKENEENNRFAITKENCMSTSSSKKEVVGLDEIRADLEGIRQSAEELAASYGLSPGEYLRLRDEIFARWAVEDYRNTLSDARRHFVNLLRIKAKELKKGAAATVPAGQSYAERVNDEVAALLARARTPEQERAEQDAWERAINGKNNYDNEGNEDGIDW